MPLSRLQSDWSEKVCDGLLGALDREPWRELERGERVRFLPELVMALVHQCVPLASTGQPESNVERAACDHARHRGAHGFQEWAVLEEYYLLRLELARILQDQLTSGDTDALLARVDDAISRATVTALRCMHGLPCATR